MKVIKYLILSLILLIGINVYASNQYISYRDAYNDIDIYYNGTILPGPSCMSYDDASNTLTFDNCNFVNSHISISDMGDITLKFIGDNNIEIANDSIYENSFINAANSTSITIQGPGNINVSSHDNQSTQGDCFLDLYYNDLITFDSVNITLDSSNDYEFQFIENHYGPVVTINNSNISGLGKGDDWSEDIAEIIDSTINIEYFNIYVKHIKNSTITGIGRIHIEADSDFSKQIENSTINLKYAEIGLEINDSQAGLPITIEDSYIVLDRLTGSEYTKYLEKYQYVPTFDHLPMYAVAPQGVTVSFVNTDVVEGGKMLTSCGNVGGNNLCVYYVGGDITEEENAQVIGIAAKAMAGYSLSAEEKALINKTPLRVVLGKPKVGPEPTPEPDPGKEDEIIHNVPKTGIIVVLGTLIGISALVAGCYLVYNTNKRVKN